MAGYRNWNWDSKSRTYAPRNQTVAVAKEEVGHTAVASEDAVRIVVAVDFHIAAALGVVAAVKVENLHSFNFKAQTHSE